MTSGSADFALDGTSVTQALAQGWTVLVPDYEGPGSDFLGATGEPREVLDGIRATIAFPGSGVTANSPVGLWNFADSTLIEAAPKSPKLLIFFLCGADVSAETSVVPTYCLVDARPTADPGSRSEDTPAQRRERL